MKKIRAIVCNHMDLIWRRTFDRDFTFKGENYVSYAKLEEYYILDNIKLARENPEYKFTIESVEVIRKFLERNPMYTDEVKQMYKDGRISTLFTGNNIIDINLCNGESIVRNFLYGKRWMKTISPKESQICMRTDAFGNSAQLPQIIRGFDCKYIGRICYSTIDGNYWKGLDGTYAVTTPFEIVFESGGYYKYPPCKKCKGYGCKACNYRGIDEDHVKNQTIYMDRMDISKVKGEGSEYILLGAEELMPRTDIFDFKEKYKNELDVEFSSYDELLEETIDLSMVDNPPEEEIATTVEMNTNNTGVYTTRIRMKQRLRECENKMSAAELLNYMSFTKTGKTNNEEIEGIWRNINLTMFHDAVTATHIDAAYDELMDVFDEAEEGIEKLNKNAFEALLEKDEDVITVFNPTDDTVEQVIDVNGDYVLYDSNGSTPTLVGDKQVLIQALKPYEAREYKKVKEENKYTSKITSFEQKDNVVSQSILTDVVKTEDIAEDDGLYNIENEYFKIIFDNRGVKEIFDKKKNMAICKEAEYSPFEFVLEHDDGSAWATMSTDFKRRTLKNKTSLAELEESENCKKIRYKLTMPDSVIAYSVTGIAAETEIILYKNSNKIYMNTRIFWDTFNHRIRIAIPLTFSGKDMYEIPYGYLEREEYGISKIKENSEPWAAAMNDYPAINWAGVQGENVSVALFNQGTPAHYITNNSLGGRTIFVTPLRSPANGTYLHDPAAYSMTDWDGMRDAGTHEFSYMLASYDEGFDKNKAVPDGNAFNAKLYITEGHLNTVEMPELVCENARIASVKISEDDESLILRIAEYHGAAGDGEIKLPQGIKNVYETNMNEETKEELKITEGTVKLQFRPFEIKTIKITK